MKSSLGNGIATAFVCGIAAVLSQFSACGLSGPFGDQKIEPVIYDKISLTTYPNALSRAGRVIARDNGAFDFVPFVYCRGANPCPAQLEAIVARDNGKMLEQSLHFVDLPVRPLRDGSWVVARDPLQYIWLPNAEASRASRMGQGIRVLHQIPPGKRLISFERNGAPDYAVTDASLNLAGFQRETPISAPASLPQGTSIVEIDLGRIDSSQWEALARTLGSRFDVHRLKGFATKTLAHNFNYMLRLETDPNSGLVDEIDALGLNHQAVLASRTMNDTAWAHEHQGHTDGIHFTAPVGSPAELDNLLKIAPSYGDKLWAIQVGKSDRTAEMVKTINATRYISYVDATPYDPQQETSSSACATALVELNSNVTTTLRPLDCLSRMRVFKPW
jgi:hypothetical protein